MKGKRDQMRAPRPIRVSGPALVGARKKTRKKPVEHELPIHKACLRCLETSLLIGSIVHHSPNELGVGLETHVARKLIAKQKAMGMKPGWPDLEAIALQRDGTFIFFVVEIKADTGELSETQIDVRKRMQAMGVKHCVARSVNDVMDFLFWEAIDNRLVRYKPKGPRPND